MKGWVASYNITTGKKKAWSETSLTMLDIWQWVLGILKILLYQTHTEAFAFKNS